MAQPQGAGILADMTARKALDQNCSKVRPSISTLLCIHLRWHWTSNLSLTKSLIPFFFFKFCFFLFGSVTLDERLPGGKTHHELVSAYGRVFCIHTAFSCLLIALLGNRSALPVKMKPLPPDHTACCTLT